MHDIHRDQFGEPAHIPHAHDEQKEESRFDQLLKRYGEFLTPFTALVLVCIAWYFGEHSQAGIAPAMAAVAITGYPILKNSIISTVANRKLNAEVLVSIALIASVWVGEYIAGAMVALMMVTGELLEDLTIARTGQAIRSLMELEPESARVVRHGREIRLPIEEVLVGDVVVVRPGEKIPVDGDVFEGRGEVDQAAITGESMPVAKDVGDPVFGGTLNQLGALKIEVTRVGKETTLARIIQLVHSAQLQKPPIERIADRFAAWFTPVMLTLAALVWLLTGEVLRAVTVLVVACPCAMVIATPTAVVAGIGNAARKGILVKGGEVMETLSKLTAFAFDKTGTLTFGTPQVVQLKAFGDTDEAEVIRLAASAEKDSGHPLAAAILARAEQDGVSFDPPEHTEVIVGRGVSAYLKGDGGLSKEILIGNQALFAEKNISLPDAALHFTDTMARLGASAVFVAENTTVLGGVGIADTVRPEAASSIADLRRLGVNKVILLTGDTEATARSALAGVGIDVLAADLMPEQKLEYIRELHNHSEKVAMVGDGINDAPALMEADVGIAMGSIGTDTAIAAADIALTSDELSRLAEVIALSRKTIQVIKQSFLISIGINVVALLLASTGEIGPILGAFIHNIGSIIVVGNSSRLIGYTYSREMRP